MGASERAIAALFAQVRAHAPCLLLLDELQALFGRRGGVGAKGEGEDGATGEDGGGGGIGSTGRQMLSQLLLELDSLSASNGGGSGSRASSGDGPLAETVASSKRGASPALVVIGVTNTPGALDPALLRPGRLEHCLYLPPPGRSTRRALLAERIRKMPLALHSFTPPRVEGGGSVG